MADSVRRKNVVRTARAAGWKGNVVETKLPEGLLGRFGTASLGKYNLLDPAVMPIDEKNARYDNVNKRMVEGKVKEGDAYIDVSNIKKAGGAGKEDLVVAHELGHGMGMSHSGNLSLMKEGTSNDSFTAQPLLVNKDLERWTREIAGPAVDTEFKKTVVDKVPRSRLDRMFEYVTGVLKDIPKPSSAVGEIPVPAARSK